MGPILRGEMTTISVLALHFRTCRECAEYPIEKRLSFCSHMSMLSPAIACLTETCLDKSVNDSAVLIGNPYSVIVRSYRTHGHHGGILIAFHNNFLKDIEIKYSSKSENDCVVLFKYAGLTLCVVLVYLPPRGSQFYVKPIVAELRFRAITSEVEKNYN